MKWILTATVISIVFIVGCVVFSQWEINNWWRENPSLKRFAQDQRTDTKEHATRPKTIPELEAELKKRTAQKNAHAIKREAQLTDLKRQLAEAEGVKRKIEQELESALRNPASQKRIKFTPEGELSAHDEARLNQILSDFEAIGTEPFEKVYQIALDAGVDMEAIKAETKAFSDSLSPTERVEYLFLLVDCLHTGDDSELERFEAERGH